MTQEEGEGCLQLGEHQGPGRMDALPGVGAGQESWVVQVQVCTQAGVSACGWHKAGHMRGPAGKVERRKRT